MFGIFVFAFSAAVSFWTSTFFYAAWKKDRSPVYGEFCMFFFLLGAAFIAADVPAVADGFTASVSSEFAVFLFTLAVGVTLLSNMKNIQKHRNPILFLGLGFLVGGVSAVFIPVFNTFAPVLFGYALLFFTFIFIALFTFTLSRESVK